MASFEISVFINPYYTYINGYLHTYVLVYLIAICVYIGLIEVGLSLLSLLYI